MSQLWKAKGEVKPLVKAQYLDSLLPLCDVVTGFKQCVAMSQDMALDVRETLLELALTFRHDNNLLG